MLFDVVAVAAPNLPLNIVLHGNSLFSSVGERVAALLPDANVFQRNVGGATTAQLEDEFEDEVHSQWDPDRLNVVLVWEGIDHINDAGGTASSAHAAYEDYVATAESFGWRVFVCTIIDTLEYTSSNPHPTRGDLEPERDGCNTLLRADRAGAFGIVDFAARAELSDASDLTFFNGDGIHLVGAGQDAVAEEIAEVLG